jgi:23S rRNA-/tRNA-specific pseudouridylate synthase
MHQIRVHLALSGLPVLGDRLYGVAGVGELVAPRPMLHAARLELDHPVTGRRLAIESPLPEDYESLRRALGGGTFDGTF